MVGLPFRFGFEPLLFLVKPTLVGSESISKIMNASMHAAACRERSISRWMRVPDEDTLTNGLHLHIKRILSGTCAPTIMNLRTGNASPQYHVVYDDLLTAVPNGETGGIIDQMTFNPQSWLKVVGSLPLKVYDRERKIIS
jgi:hypothetical protein